MDGTLAWPLESAARSHGARTAVVEGERRVTYHELHHRVRRVGAGLAEAGIAPGAVVAVLLANSLEHLESWLAVPAYGRVLTTLNTRLAVPELAIMLEDSGAEILIVDSVNLEAGRRLRELVPLLKRLLFTGDGPCPDDCLSYESLMVARGVAPPDLDPDSLAVIMYTGGTTGRPKGVMLSHSNLLSNCKHTWHQDGIQREDVVLHSPPFFHMAGAQMIHAVTWVGGTHVLLPRFTPSGYTHAIVEHQATVALLVPTMVHMLLDYLDGCPADLDSLRLLHYGASPMSTKQLHRAAKTLGCDFVQGYGMTEASPGVTFLSSQDHRRALNGEAPERLNSVGYALPGVQLDIRDGNGRSVADGTVGEVWVRGPNIMLGYLNCAEENGQALVDDWYRTGDGGYCDADGYLFLVDRIKDMIITGGENVYSIEVERVLDKHPQVAEVAVIGVPDVRWGERVHAVVVTEAGAGVTEADLIEHCRERIAHYKAPRSVELRTEPLPKSDVGKILKQELRGESERTEQPPAPTLH
ncbi:class I adenylate-forming enzyme family protein [Streptomyces chartreusis]|uniref:Long-chain-fatty-acid--CoA ligase n=1 Tax=Streptomyces chartreusis TaxID=1969 RepID=A0A7I0NSJ7_STRCX|nr:long-chain-fatty-acid--CoA ligase [Streptomyces chartreusis]QKZ16040.1 long-chain-fatty-acid--CoA ligase [Streptomyces chartreusis]